MKIAIHHRDGSFSERWIKYCIYHNIPYKLVDCYQSDIIKQMEDCNALMWHHNHASFKDVMVAKKILFALEHSGIKVFPDFYSSWHFDDKISQKYLLEAIKAPLVQSYVFYNKQQAFDWANTTIYPKVFKLKGGAGSANVKLVNTKSESLKIIKKAFGNGYSQFYRLGNLKERFIKYKEGKDTLIGVVKGFARLFISTDFAKKQSREKGYVYFQEFIPNNTFDIRVIVIANKAFAIKRMTRKNDFRASGSGNIIFDRSQIDENCVRTAFEVNLKLKSQSIAFDFVFDEKRNPLIIEVSYGFAMEFYDKCPGYWDSSLQWHDGIFNPQDWMLEEVIKNML